MKISKKLEPLLAGLFASIIIGILSFLSFETSTGFWLMFSFGSSTLIVLVFHNSEFAQPANVFFGHLLAIVIGILFNEFLGMSYLTLGLSVGTTVTLMMYFKIIHPPAAANPLIALFADVSFRLYCFSCNSWFNSHHCFICNNKSVSPKKKLPSEMVLI